MNLRRLLRHLLTPHRVARRAFPRSVLHKIEVAISESEQRHDGELRFAVEAGLHPDRIWQGVSPRVRAIELFSQLRVWDTEHNSGVLIYVQLVDRTIEIVADRGINAKVPQASWDEICRGMEEAFRAGRFESGVLTAIGRITALLEQHFPSSGPHTNELPDQPIVL